MLLYILTFCFTGEDLLKLVCFCQFLSGSLVLAVGVSGTFGAVRESRGWMALVSTLIFSENPQKHIL